jgi:sarcosine oxidase
VNDPPAAPPAEAEVVVVGAGLLGLSAASELRRRGRDVVLLERGHVGNPRSGSHGECRIFRLGYDDPRYVEMAKLALPLWRAWEDESGTALLTTTGQLTFGPGLELLSRALGAAGAPTELLSAAEAARRFPEVAVPGPAVFEPQSGVLHARRCLEVLRRRIGTSLHEGLEVAALVADGRGVRVLTDRGPIKASAVICCAGSLTAALLATAGVDLPLRATVEQVAYFAPRSSTPPEIPVIVERGTRMIYGLPAPDSGSFKVGIHHAGPLGDPDTADLDPDPVATNALAAVVARLLPGFDPSPARSERCLYDNTSDENFVIDRIGPIIVGAGTSGHGFKFGPLLGELLADLADGLAPRIPLGWLSAGRPALAAGV